MTALTAEQTRATIAICKAFADTIKELGSIPAGHLYAHVMGRCSLEQFNALISILLGSGVIRRNGDLLVWNVE
jgi:hypothetical protein